MQYRLVISGSGGFIGSYLVPHFKKDKFDVVTVKYVEGELIFSSPLHKNEHIVLLNLAAATSGSANKFSVGYDLSIVFIEKLAVYLKKKNVTVIKAIQFSSFGELVAEKNKCNIIFHPCFKSEDKALDNYQYWKIKQREAVSSFFSNVIYLVIPFVSEEYEYKKIKSSLKFRNFRYRRKVLITRLHDIYIKSKQLISNEAISGIHFPEFKKVEFQGSFAFLKTALIQLGVVVIKKDFTRLDKLAYQLFSQMLSTAPY